MKMSELTPEEAELHSAADLVEEEMAHLIHGIIGPLIDKGKGEIAGLAISFILPKLLATVFPMHTSNDKIKLIAKRMGEEACSIRDKAAKARADNSIDYKIASSAASSRHRGMTYLSFFAYAAAICPGILKPADSKETVTEKQYEAINKIIEDTQYTDELAIKTAIQTYFDRELANFSPNENN